MSKGNDGEFSPGTRYVELTLRDTNQLTFVFLIQVLIRLEKTLLKQDNIRDAVRKATKVKRVYDDESKQWVAGKPPTAEDMTQMETKLEETINRVYPQIRDRILDATKKKIVEVMEEPIVIDKEGVAQPLHWLKERPGL
jgi:hypothetical protein